MKKCCGSTSMEGMTPSRSIVSNHHTWISSSQRLVHTRHQNQSPQILPVNLFHPLTLKLTLYIYIYTPTTQRPMHSSDPLWMSCTLAKAPWIFCSLIHWLQFSIPGPSDLKNFKHTHMWAWLWVWLVAAPFMKIWRICSCNHNDGSQLL